MQELETLGIIPDDPRYSLLTSDFMIDNLIQELMWAIWMSDNRLSFLHLRWRVYSVSVLIVINFHSENDTILQRESFNIGL